VSKTRTNSRVTLGLNPDCHYGDHRWQDNGWCSDCGAFNGGLLQWQRTEKAIREGRFHFGHFHLTVARKAACRRQPDAEWTDAYGQSEVPA
jgi:hypothetical protein